MANGGTGGACNVDCTANFRITSTRVQFFFLFFSCFLSLSSSTVAFLLEQQSGGKWNCSSAVVVVVMLTCRRVPTIALIDGMQEASKFLPMAGCASVLHRVGCVRRERECLNAVELGRGQLSLVLEVLMVP